VSLRSADRALAVAVVVLALTGCRPASGRTAAPEVLSDPLADARDPSTALLTAAREGRLLAVDPLLGRGARIDHQEVTGLTPLLTAIRAGQSLTARRLVDRGADIGTGTPPWNPLRLAAFLGDWGTTAVLLAKGAPVDEPDPLGRTALMYAASQGHADVVRQLLEAGARHEARDPDGNTALLLAANNGHAEAARLLVAAGADRAARNRAGETPSRLAQVNGHASVAAVLDGPPPRPAGPLPADDVVPTFDEAARRAWTWIEASYQPATGLTDGTQGWTWATHWDVGSMIASYYAARELGLLDESSYRDRIDRLLSTLEQAPLFEGKTFERTISTRSRGEGRGGGWSTTDLGRLFLWLKAVAHRDPAFAARAEAVVRRNDPAALLQGGYMRGVTFDGGRRREFQEGHIGYEQYSAEGFAAWQLPVDKARGFARHALPLRIMDRQAMADVRGFDRLTSDPVVLLGLELGWTPESRRLAEEMLAAQRERWRRSGRVTIVGEDALSRPPHFFYYYCLYTRGRDFAIDVQDPDAVVSGPRWVSAKGAFAWHALLPSEYTRHAVRSVRAAAGPGGWASGTWEEGLGSTGTLSVNTQAVILEAALYARRGKPILEGVPAGAPKP
jgi:hypothetical protein